MDLEHAHLTMETQEDQMVASQYKKQQTDA